MKFPLFLSALSVLGISATAQITTAENGLNTPIANTVQLGGSLLQNTTIDLSGYGFHLKNGNTPLFSLLSNGNVGIGNPNPEARLTFPNAGDGDEATGMTWSSGSFTYQYGIHRTAGPWSAPNYQQLRLGWETGIILDPGASHPKSYVDIQGNGLRVTSGNVGIGTTSPGARLSFTSVEDSDDPIGISWYNPEPTGYGIHRTAGPWAAPDYQQLRFGWKTGIILDPGTGYGKSYVEVAGGGLRVTSGAVGIGTATPQNSLGIRAVDPNSSGLQFERLTGTSPAGTGNGKVLSVDNGGNVVLVNDIGGSGTTWALTGNGLTDPATSFIGTTDAQPLVFRTNNQPIARLLPNGNFLLNKFEDNGLKFQAVGDGSFIGTVDAGTSLWLGDNVYNRAVGMHTYGDGAGTNRYTAFGHNMWEAGSMYDGAKQGGGIYLDDRSGVLPIRFMYKQAGMSGSYFSSGISANGNFLIKDITDNGNALQVNGTISASGLVIATGAAAGKVLTSDANGNATWQVAAGGTTAGWGLGGNNVTSPTTLGTTNNQDLPVITNNTVRMRVVGGTGNVIIGSSNITDAGYKLAVDGNIRTRKVRVDQDTWADYVFENTYQLRSIYELEQFIQTQKHLPDVPSAVEVKKEGLDLGDNQAVLLKKIEELTLYMIEQNKRNDDQQKLIQELQQQVKELKKATGK